VGYRITGLSAEPFRHLYGLSDSALAQHGVIRYTVDQYPGFPDRIEMRDAAVGETVLLLNHVCQPAATPYHASHAIFVREGATQAYDAVDGIPEVMQSRLLSLRAYTADGMMVDAAVCQGGDVEPTITKLLADDRVGYIHAHNAIRGCYSGRIDRA
jgi:hypothetical protein